MNSRHQVPSNEKLNFFVATYARVSTAGNPTVGQFGVKTQGVLEDYTLDYFLIWGILLTAKSKLKG